MLPGTVVAAKLMAPVFWNARLPLARVKGNAAPGKLFACVDRSILPAEVKLLVGALNTPVSAMSPVNEVAASVPPTVEAPKVKLLDAIAALPGALSDTGPVNALVEVARLMLPADVKLLPAASVRIPLCVMSPTVVAADNAPPTLEAPRFKFLEVIAATRVPGVLSAPGRGKLLGWVARLIPWLAVRARKLPPAAVSTPLSLTPPVAAVPVNTPPTLEVPRFKLAELIDAAPVPVVLSETAPAKLLACVARLMLWLAVWVVKLPPPAVIAPLSAIPPVVAVPVSVPPTLDAPKFNAAASMVAAPVPVVLSETAPVKVFPALPRVMA